MVTEPAALEGWAAVDKWASATALLEAHGELEFVVSGNPDPANHGSVSRVMSLQAFAGTVLRQADPDDGDTLDADASPDTRSIFGLLKRGNPMAADLGSPKPDKEKKNKHANSKKKKKKNKKKGKEKGEKDHLPQLPRYEPGSPMVPPLPPDQRPRPQLFFGPALGGAMPRDHGASWNLLIRGRRRCVNLNFGPFSVGDDRRGVLSIVCHVGGERMGPG